MPSSSSADKFIKHCHVSGKLQVENKSVSTAAHQHPIANKPVHYLHELPLAAEKRYESLFKQLDRSGNEIRSTFFFFFCLENSLFKSDNDNDGNNKK